MNKVIVSRHPATVQFIRETLGSAWADAPVITGNAGPDDVRGKVVVGNLPSALACHALLVGAVEFTGAPPRGAEYGQEEMRAAGACIRWYETRALRGPVRNVMLAGAGCAAPKCGELYEGGVVLSAHFLDNGECWGDVSYAGHVDVWTDLGGHGSPHVGAHHVGTDGKEGFILDVNDDPAFGGMWGWVRYPA